MPGKHWTDRDKKTLRRQILVDRRPFNLVKIDGRTANAIRRQAMRSGIVEAGEPRLAWSLAQRRRLKKSKRQGLTPEEIFNYALLGEPTRSLWAIKKKWGRMKLSDRRRARRMRNKKVWKPGEKKRFDAFLRKHASTMTPEQIGQQWGVARSTVARRQTELGVKAPRDNVLQMEFSLAKQRRARRRARRNNLKRWAQWRDDREQEFVKLAKQLRANSKPPEERTCTDCGHSWPVRRTFFHTSEKHISIGTSMYYKQRCRLCENARRRRLRKKRNSR